MLKIVTDSTCDLPPELVARHQIEVVPAYVNIGTDSYRDEIDLARADFYANLSRYAEHPTTAAPAPGEFAEVYQRLIDGGATQILSIHVSAKLSGIINAAQAGAALIADAHIEIFDSQQLSMGIGFQALLAARAAAAGSPLDAILSRLTDIRGHIHTYAMLDTLDAIQRSGRVSFVQMQIGNLLKIKQIVDVYQGEVLPAARVRTRSKALKKMEELVQAQTPLSELAVMDTNNGAADFEAFVARFTDIEGDYPLVRTVACPAIGVHVGEKALGVTCVPQINE